MITPCVDRDTRPLSDSEHDRLELVERVRAVKVNAGINSRHTMRCELPPQDRRHRWRPLTTREHVRMFLPPAVPDFRQEPVFVL
jgi:hypothetical protein